MKKFYLAIFCMLCPLLLCGQSFSYEYLKGKKTYRADMEISDSLVTVNNYVKRGKKWKQEGSAVAFPLTLSGTVSFPDSISVAVLSNGKTYLEYSYLDSSAEGLSFTRGLYDIADFDFSELSFNGKPLKTKEGQAFRIEGLSSYALCEVSDETNYIDSLFRADARLVQISQADMQSDSYIQWWLENNPDAMGRARSVEFGTISETSSLYTAFNKAKKASRGKLQAAVVDVRGYSAVIVKNTKTQSHLLVWVEPECKNRKTQRFLSQVYFQDDNTLVLFYYKGNSTFKYRINLATRVLSK